METTPAAVGTRATPTPSRPPLSTAAAVALYVGALLGPSVLLVPGLAAEIAGPASIVVWFGMLLVSGLLAIIFTALGIRFPDGGMVAYVRAGLHRRLGPAAGWMFVAGVVVGAPVVSLIGAGYLTGLLGLRPGATPLVAAVLLALVVAVNLFGRRAGTRVQQLLVAVLLVLVLVAVAAALPRMRTDAWQPLAPHGWSALGPAALAVMLSFVGWEAITPLISRLPDPGRQLPKITGTAFGVTAVVYLALATVTIGVLGGRAGAAPVAALLDAGLGRAGAVVGSVVAIAVTLAGTNAYLSGATELTRELLRPSDSTRRGRRPAAARAPERALPPAIAGLGTVVFVATGAGWLSVAQLVAIPSTLFVSVYLLCTVAATRLLNGRMRLVAGAAAGAVTVPLLFAGWNLLVPTAIGVGSLVIGARRRPPVSGSGSPGQR